MPALFAFLHHLAAFALVAALAIELVLMRGELTLQSARLLQRVDIVFGISAGVVVIAGAHRAFMFEKGWLYYSHSIPFIAKISLFVIMGLLSIYPTIEFLRWRKATKAGAVPALTPEKRRTIRMLIHSELTGVVLILLCAALMAKGVGSI